MPIPTPTSPLVNFIQLHSKAVETAEAILAFASTESIVTRMPGKWTWAGLIDVFGKTAIDAISAAVKTADRLTYDLLAGGGIDFSNDKTQDAIDAMQAGGLLDGQTAASLKLLGVERKSPWAVMYSALPLPTVPEIEAAKAEIERTNALAAIEAMVMLSIHEAAVNGTSVDDAKAAIINGLT